MPLLRSYNTQVPPARQYFGLDFLRGISILLVLCRHQYLAEPARRMGWIGVDLFFIISGFLIGSKLFEEHLRYGRINGRRFLVRRFLRIYPLYYVVSLLYIIWFLYRGMPLHIRELFFDLVLVQNYTSGWGFLQAPTWSLAIEEHFYLVATLLAYVSFNARNVCTSNRRFAWGLLCFLFLTIVAGNLFRFLSVSSGNPVITRTDQRLEELVLGLTVSYFVLFRGQWSLSLIIRKRRLLLLLALVCTSWTPIIDVTASFFAPTFGITLLGLGFAALLLCTITSDDKGSRFGWIIRTRLGQIVSRVGRYSFAVYLIHSLVNSGYSLASTSLDLPQHHVIAFIITTVISLILGALLTEFVEQPVLRLRNRLAKSRV